MPFISNKGPPFEAVLAICRVMAVERELLVLNARAKNWCVLNCGCDAHSGLFIDQWEENLFTTVNILLKSIEWGYLLICWASADRRRPFWNLALIRQRSMQKVANKSNWFLHGWASDSDTLLILIILNQDGCPLDQDAKSLSHEWFTRKRNESLPSRLNRTGCSAWNR